MSLYKQEGSEVWWLNVSHQGHRLRESTGEYDRSAAQRIHDERKAALWKLPKLKGKKWSDAVDHWLEMKSPSDAEVASLLHFSRHYPDRLLSAVTPESVHKVLSAMCDTSSTYNRHRARVVGILRLSKIDLALDKRDEGTKPERMWLRPAQWEKLLAELPAHQKLWARFAVSTGLRQANQFGLTWDRVDMKRRYCWIERDTAKGKKSFTVPLNDEAMDVLKAVQGEHPEFCFTFRGKPISEIKTAFQKACVRAGIGRFEPVRSGHDEDRTPGQSLRGQRSVPHSEHVHASEGADSGLGSERVGGKRRATTTGSVVQGSNARGAEVSQYSGFVWHGLRHTWATWHVQNGTPLDVLQRLGAWSDYKMVLIYAHHAPEYLATYAGNSHAHDPD